MDSQVSKFIPIYHFLHTNGWLNVESEEITFLLH